MTTRQTIEKLPQVVRDTIAGFRNNMKADPLHRELYLCKSNGYIDGLRDAGLITEQDRRVLRVYMTV